MLGKKFIRSEEDIFNATLLFIDTFQGKDGFIKAIAIKIRTQNEWTIHLYEPLLPWEQLEFAYESFYSNLDSQDWIHTFKDSNEEIFKAKEYYNNRYTVVSYVTELDMKNILQSCFFTLIDTGEQTVWFRSFAKGDRYQYEIRHMSIKELGDEREFELPVTLSRSEENELSQIAKSIELKVSAMIQKFGTRVITHSIIKDLKDRINFELSK